jgi:hypothetical protein
MFAVTRRDAPEAEFIQGTSGWYDCFRFPRIRRVASVHRGSSTRTRTPSGRSISMTPTLGQAQPRPARTCRRSRRQRERFRRLCHHPELDEPGRDHRGRPCRRRTGCRSPRRRQLHNRLFEIPCRGATTETRPPAASTSAISAAFSPPASTAGGAQPALRSRRPLPESFRASRRTPPSLTPAAPTTNRTPAQTGRLPWRHCAPIVRAGGRALTLIRVGCGILDRSDR